MFEVTWLGHSAVALRSETCHLVIDPWLTGNPQAAALPNYLTPAAILVTHGHQDHLGDAVELSKQFDAPVIACPEVAAFVAKAGATSELINYGGTYMLDLVSIKCVPALHSSSLGPERQYGGNPCGFVVRMDGLTAYHAGDTCLFGDMRLIGETHAIDLALLPIGGRTTMDPAEALSAVKMLKPRYVAAIHFNTWNFIAQDAGAFGGKVDRETDAQFLTLTAGIPQEIPSHA